MMKKIIKDMAIVSYMSLCAMLVFGVDAKAYIDPSVMTYLIQAVAGVVIALGAAVGIYFRRAKKKLNDKLGLDENRNKEVESDDVIIKTSDDKSEG